MVMFSKVLVTVGAGFIGSHLVDRLTKMKCFVRVVDNLSSGNLENVARSKITYITKGSLVAHSYGFSYIFDVQLW